MPDELLTAAQLAKKLGLRQNTIYEMASQGRIPSVRISSHAVRFDWGEVLAALKGKKKTGKG